MTKTMYTMKAKIYHPYFSNPTFLFLTKNLRTIYYSVFTLSLSVCIIASKKVNCQDIHFSQFNQTPILVNPSLTGVFNGDMRAGLNFKDQWRNFPGSVPSYRTYSFSFDAGLFKKKWAHSYIGSGLSVFSDKSGDAKMGTTQVALSLSSVLVVADNHQVSVGLQGGYAQRSINLNNPDLVWESQFQNEKYVETISSGEPHEYLPFTFADFSAGASWHYGSEETSIFKNNRFRANAGIAYQHLNRPIQDYYLTEKLHAKLVVHGGLFIGLSNSNISVVPSLIYFRQGAANEINCGSYLRYTLVESSKYTGIMKESAFYLGGFYRFNDAVIPAIMLEFANYSLGLTYDINISKLRPASNGKGGPEISFRYSTPNPFTYKYGNARTKSVRFL